MILPQTAILLDGSNKTFRVEVEPIGVNVSRGRYNYTDASSHVMYTRYIELVPGQLVECEGSLYFVKYIAQRRLQKEVLLDVLNYTSVDFLRLQETGDGRGNPTKSWNALCSIPAKIEFLRGATHYKDHLLLEKTELKVTVQETSPVRVMDRMMLSGKAYRIDALDATNAPGLLLAQLSTDTR